MVKNLKSSFYIDYQNTSDGVKIEQAAMRKICPIEIKFVITSFLYDNHKRWCDNNGITPFCLYESHAEWCDENFYDDYILFNNHLSTKTEEDAVAFKLRWS